MSRNVDSQNYDYFEVCIACSKSEVDEIENNMIELGACSVTYRDAQDIAILEPSPGEMPLWQSIEMTAMFTKNFSQQDMVNSCVKLYPTRNISSKILVNQVWERTWLEHFKPMQFGSRTWIIPSEYKAVDEKAVNIYLDPGLAFGTGTHATTALCLTWIDENNLLGLDVIDFGCGSGILAIAALKHGANKVYCTDIDTQAVESTLVNAQNNEVKESIVVINPQDVRGLKNLDVVLANILAAPLMSLVEEFSSLLKANGEIIMSGILEEQTGEVIEKFDRFFKDFKVSIMDGWASIYAKRKD